MKSDPSTLQKSTLVKKTTRPLNEKKNSIPTETTLKKEKSKLNLVLTEHSQLPVSITQKLTSPKTLNFPSSIPSPKTQGNEDLFKPQKSELKKTAITNAKIKKTGISKHEPIKKQLLPVMKSPKNGKISTVQSESYLNSQKDHSINFNQESNLTIDLETSIFKTDREIDEINENNSILNQSLLKNTQFAQESKIDELTKTSNEQIEQIKRLKERNQELDRKLQKLKQSQDENRKKLKERISSFNEEGEEMRVAKERIVELQKQILALQNQNIILKNSSQVSLRSVELSKISVINQEKVNEVVNKIQFLKLGSKIISLQIVPPQCPLASTKKQMIDQSVMTTFDDEICDQALSFINGSGSSNFEESILSYDKIKDSRIESISVIPSLQIEAIKNSYEDKYQEKILEIQRFYKQGMIDIEKRYKLLVEQTRQIVKSQENQIFSLETKIDNLYEKLEDCICNRVNSQIPTLQTDEQKLKHMMQVSRFKQKLSKKEEELKNLREQTHNKEIQCKKVSSELDIQRIRFNLNCEIRTVTKQLIEVAEKQQIQILMEELKQQKEKTSKLLTQNEKKEDLIKKMSVQHASGNGGKNNTKKIKK